MKTGLASSGPVISYFAGTFSGLVAGGISAVIFIGYSFASFAERMANGRSNSGPEAVMEAVIRVGDFLSALKVNTTQSNKPSAIAASLGVVEVLAREITGLKQGEIAVSVAVYEGSSTQRMKLLYRNAGNTRPVGRTFDGEAILGHRACLAGRGPQIVNDIRRFGAKALKSPTQSEVNYRSIVIFPLVVDRNGNQKVRGFLSVDATVPYAFYGNRGRKLIVNAEPIIQQLQALL